MNKPNSAIDISLKSWRLVVASDIDASKWNFPKGKPLGKPHPTQCGDVEGWGIPANPDERAVGSNTEGWSFATHWNKKTLPPGKEYIDFDAKEGVIVF